MKQTIAYNKKNPKNKRKYLAIRRHREPAVDEKPARTLLREWVCEERGEPLDR